MTKSDERHAEEPTEQDLPSGATAGVKQSPRLGRRLDTWGWVAMVLGAVLYGGGVSLDGDAGPWWADVVTLVAGLGLVVFGLSAVLRGRRHLHRVLPDLRSVPAGEPMVLFLRTFSDDLGFAKTVASGPGRWLM